MDKKFEQIYFSDDGYWRGKCAIQKLYKASGSTKEEAEKWLLRQPLYQIYLPPPKYIPRPNASMSLFAKPNDIHQSDLLSLSQGYIALRLEKSFKKFYGRYQDLIKKYQRSVNVMVNDSFPR